MLLVSEPFAIAESVLVDPEMLLLVSVSAVSYTHLTLPTIYSV